MVAGAVTCVAFCFVRGLLNLQMTDTAWSEESTRPDMALNNDSAKHGLEQRLGQTWS
jgi:hypothetical protein